MPDCPPNTVGIVENLPGGGQRQGCQGDAGWEGDYTETDPSGRPTLIGQFADGKATGLWTELFTDGSRMQGKMGERGPIGPWELRDPTGRLQVTLRYAELVEPGTPPPTSEGPFDWVLHTDAPARELVRSGEFVWVWSRQALFRLDPRTGRVDLASPTPAGLQPGLIGDAAGNIYGISQVGDQIRIGPEGLQRLNTPLGATHIVPLRTGDLVLREGDGRITRRDPNTGALRWRNAQAMEAIAPALSEGIAFAARPRGISAIHLDTGQTLFQYPLPAAPRRLWPHPAGGVVVLDAKDRLSWIRQPDTPPLWQLSLPGASLGEFTLHGEELRVTIGRSAERINLQQGSRDTPFTVPDAGAADILPFEETVCWTGRATGLYCPNERGEPWTIPLPGLLLPPLVIGERLLLAEADGTLRGLRLKIAMMAAGDPRIPPTENLETVWWATPIGEGPIWEGVLGTADYFLEEDSETCEDSVAWLGLPEAPPAEGPPEALPLVIPSLTVWTHPELNALRPAPGWTAEKVASNRYQSLFLQWWPTLVEAHLQLSEPSGTAALEALLRCKGPPARFQGEVLLDAGGHRTRRQGRLRLEALPQRLDGQDGCLIHVSQGAEDLGWWSSPSLPGWVEIEFESATDTEPLDFGDPLAPDLPLGALPTGLRMRLPAVGTPDQREVGPEGPLMGSIDGHDSSGPTWVLHHPSADPASPEGASGVHLRLPIGDLRHAQLEQTESGWEPEVAIEEDWSFIWESPSPPPPFARLYYQPTCSAEDPNDDAPTTEGGQGAVP
jgi:hypothetical protein